ISSHQNLSNTTLKTVFTSVIRRQRVNLYSHFCLPVSKTYKKAITGSLKHELQHNFSNTFRVRKDIFLTSPCDTKLSPTLFYILGNDSAPPDSLDSCVFYLQFNSRLAKKQKINHQIPKPVNSVLHVMLG